MMDDIVPAPEPIIISRFEADHWKKRLNVSEEELLRLASRGLGRTVLISEQLPPGLGEKRPGAFIVRDDERPFWRFVRKTTGTPAAE